MKTCKPTTAVASKITAFFWFLLIVVVVVLTPSSSSFAMTVAKSSSHDATAATTTTAAATTSTTSSSSLDEDSANLQKWAGRWSENNIGWHRDYIHPSLKVHGDKILPPRTKIITSSSSSATDDVSDQQETCVDKQEEGAAAAAAALLSSYRVFVPLCGKSIDMAHMASLDSVSQVVGLDGIEKALLEFAKENPQLEISIPTNPPSKNTDDDESEDINNVVLAESSSSSLPSQQAAAAAVSSSSSSSSPSSYKYFNGKKIQLIKGDFFALDSTDTSGRFEAIYDRASMVAVEPALRRDYVAVMGRLIQPGGKILLAAIERDDDAGPPFSLTQSHVRELYEGQEWVESITVLEGGHEEEDDRFREGIYLIQAKK